MPLHNVFTLVFRDLPVSEVCDTTYENVTLDAATRRHHRRRVRCVRRPIKKRHATGQERQPASTMACASRPSSQESEKATPGACLRLHFATTTMYTAFEP